MKLALLIVLVAPALGKCPDVPSLDVFEPEKYVGQWYEAARYPLIFELGETCVQANYTLQPGGTIRLENRGKKPDGNIDSIFGTASVKDPAHPAALSVHFDEGFHGSYNVIRTDYTGTALVYSCASVLGLASESAWLLSRTDSMDQSVMDEYVKILKDAGSNTNGLHMTKQDCGSVF